MARYGLVRSRAGANIGVNLGAVSDVRLGAYVGRTAAEIDVGDPDLPEIAGRDSGVRTHVAARHPGQPCRAVAAACCRTFVWRMPSMRPSHRESGRPASRRRRRSLNSRPRRIHSGASAPRAASSPTAASGRRWKERPPATADFTLGRGVPAGRLLARRDPRRAHVDSSAADTCASWDVCRTSWVGRSTREDGSKTAMPFDDWSKVSWRTQRQCRRGHGHPRRACSRRRAPTASMAAGGRTSASAVCSADGPRPHYLGMTRWLRVADAGVRPCGRAACRLHQTGTC